MSAWSDAIDEAQRVAGSDLAKHMQHYEHAGRARLAHAYLAGCKLRERKAELGTGRPGRGKHGSPWLDGLRIEQRHANRLVQLSYVVDENPVLRDQVLSADMGVKEAIRALRSGGELPPPREPVEKVSITDPTTGKIARVPKSVVDAIRQSAPKAAPPKAEPAPKGEPRLRHDLDDGLAKVTGTRWARLVSLLRHDELWINPAAARQAIARELLKAMS